MSINSKIVALLEEKCPVLQIEITQRETLRISRYAVIPWGRLFSAEEKKQFAEGDLPEKLADLVVRDPKKIVEFLNGLEPIPHDDVVSHIKIVSENAMLAKASVSLFLIKYLTTFAARFLTPEIFSTKIKEAYGYLGSLDLLSKKELFDLLLGAANALGEVYANSKESERTFYLITYGARPLTEYAGEVLESVEYDAATKLKLQVRVKENLGSFILGEVKQLRSIAESEGLEESHPRIARRMSGAKDEAFQHFTAAYSYQKELMQQVDSAIDSVYKHQLSIARLNIEITQTQQEDVASNKARTLDALNAYLSVYKLSDEEEKKSLFYEHRYTMAQAIQNIVDIFFDPGQQALKLMRESGIHLDDFVDFVVLLDELGSQEAEEKFSFMHRTLKKFIPAFILSDLASKDQVAKLLALYQFKDHDSYCYNDLKIQYLNGGPVSYQRLSMVHMAILMADYDKFEILLKHLNEMEVISDVLSFMPCRDDAIASAELVDFIIECLDSSDSRRVKCVARWISEIFKHNTESFPIDSDASQLLHQTLHDNVVFALVTYLIELDARGAVLLLIQDHVGKIKNTGLLQLEKQNKLDPFSIAFAKRDLRLFAQLLLYAPDYLYQQKDAPNVLYQIIEAIKLKDATADISKNADDTSHDDVTAYFLTLIHACRFSQLIQILPLLDWVRVDGSMSKALWRRLIEQGGDSIYRLSPEQSTDLSILALCQDTVNLAILKNLIGCSFQKKKLDPYLVEMIYWRYPLAGNTSYPFDHVYAIDTGVVLYNETNKKWNGLLVELNKLQLDVTWEKTDRCINIAEKEATVCLDIQSAEWRQWYPNDRQPQVSVKASDVLRYLRLVLGNTFLKLNEQEEMQQLQLIGLVEKIPGSFNQLSEQVIDYFYQKSEVKALVDFHQDLQKERNDVAKLNEAYERCQSLIDGAKSNSIVREMLSIAKEITAINAQLDELVQCRMLISNTREQHRKLQQDLSKLQRRMQGPERHYQKLLEKNAKEALQKQREKERKAQLARKKEDAKLNAQRKKEREEKLKQQQAFEKQRQQGYDAYTHKMEKIGSLKDAATEALTEISSIKSSTYNLAQEILINLRGLKIKTKQVLVTLNELNKYKISELDTWVSNHLMDESINLGKMKVSVKATPANKARLNRYKVKIHKVREAVEYFQKLPSILKDCLQLHTLTGADRFTSSIQPIESKICSLLLYKECDINAYKVVDGIQENISILKDQILKAAEDARVSVTFCSPTRPKADATIPSSPATPSRDTTASSSSIGSVIHESPDTQATLSSSESEFHQSPDTPAMSSSTESLVQQSPPAMITSPVRVVTALFQPKATPKREQQLSVEAPEFVPRTKDPIRKTTAFSPIISQPGHSEHSAANRAIGRPNEACKKINDYFGVEERPGFVLDVDLKDSEGRLRMMQQLFNLPLDVSTKLGNEVSDNHFSFSNKLI